MKCQGKWCAGNFIYFSLFLMDWVGGFGLREGRGCLQSVWFLRKFEGNEKEC